jgi:8-oxo-dGTP pyrophosphatase MutT (NUDIX family)
MRHRRDTSAGVIVFHRSDDGCRFLLLLSRLTRKPLWEFPKGGVTPGESLRETALRELLEETGLADADIRVVPGFERTEDYRFSAGAGADRVAVRKEVTYYLAEAAHMRVRPASAEVIDHAWLSLQEAKRRLRYRARRALLDAAAETVGCAGAQSETSSRKREARRRSGSDSA